MFHENLNSIDSNIKFTIEHEDHGQIAFLDTVVSREDGTISVDVYRKPTNTDRYLDFQSHHDKQHKASVASTLIHRALNLPSTADKKTRELAYITRVLEYKGYNSDFVSSILKKKSSKSDAQTPEDLV